MSIQITIGGTVYPIYRDVATEHPEAVHVALGTHSESELQEFLDGVNVADWYGDDGEYLGPDDCGLEMRWGDDLQKLVGQRVEAGTGEDHDSGLVVRIMSDDMVFVSWDSGVKTNCPISDVRVI